MFIHDRLGRRKDATGAIVDLIRVASSSGMGSTHLIGHELGHNLMSIARDAGVISDAQQQEIDALFTDKNGKFDEEAFAEAFARELKRAFFETVEKRMADVPPTKAGRALRRVADFIVTLARSFAFWRQERGLDPVTGQPLQAGQVLDAFLKRERTAVDEATQVANAARAAETRATQEAMANAPTQTVVDEDGTEVAYHEAERGDRDVTAEDFARTFGMYAPYSLADETFDSDGASQEEVTFARLVQEVAQAKANGAYDGLMAIAKLMGIPPEVLGLGGLISPSFGRIYPIRVNGQYDAASGELILPTVIKQKQLEDLPKVIDRLDLWKEENQLYKLAQATAIHEWFHALDHALASGRDADWRNDDGADEPPAAKYDRDVRFRHPKSRSLVGARLTERMVSMPEGLHDLFVNIAPMSDSVRPEVREAFGRMMEAVAGTAYGKRQANAKEWLEQYKDDIVDGKVEYWAKYISRPDEMLAHAFEQTISESNGDLSKRDYYMEGFEPPSEVDALMFPTSEEVRELLPIFREFFSALEVGVNETTGVDTLYHTADMGFGSGMLSTQYNEGVSNVTAMLALRLVSGSAISVSPDTLNRSVAVLTGSFSPYDNQGRKIRFNPNGTRAKGGSGLLHLVDERVANDYAELYLSGDRDGAIKKAVTDLLRVIEAVQHGHIVEVRGNRNTPNQVILEHKNEADGETYRAVVSWERKENGFTLTTGYRVDPKFAKTQVDVNTGESSVVLRRSEFLTSEYYGHLKRKLPELTRQIVAELFPDLQGENKSATNEERRDHIHVWSGAPQEYDHPDILFIGSGTGGQNEGYGLYASGVLGVARDKYARSYIPKNPKTWAQLPVNGDRQYKTLGEFGKRSKTWAMKGALNPEENIKIFFAALANDAVSGKIPKGNVKEALKKAILAELEREGKAAEEYNAWRGAIFNGEQVEPKTRRQERAEARAAQLYEMYLALGFNQESVLDEQINALLDVPVNRPAVMEQTWFTNRPEGDVSHLLSWFEPVTDEQRKWVEAAYDKRFADFDGYDYWKERIFKPGIIGKDFYKELHDLFLNIAHRSGMPTTDWVVQGHLVKFLLDADIDGTRYPVDYRHGHMKGELGWNYVAFSDEHLRVDHVYEYNPETDDFDLKWHESEGGASLRFTETPLGQELVAKAFDAIVGSRVDLLLRPSRYYGNPYETAKRNPRDGLVVEKLGREIDVSEPKGFAAEVSAEISRFGTREGDPTLREIRARCGSKARFYEVLGAVYETAEAVRSGLADVVTGRERAMMENAGLQAADFIKHNATARATALGRKLYLMGREFAWKLYKEDIAAARAEAQAKVREANAKTREAKAQTRNAERREETARNQAYQNRWGLAEERFMREYERALLRHQAARKVSDVREKMQEQVDLLRLREAKKRALDRERGVTFTALKATLGVDIPARLRALAGTQEDPFEAAAKLIVEIDDGFDKWVKRDRRDLLDGTEPYTYLNEQGERAYAETMGNVLKAVARDLSYGKLREALVNAADKIAREKHETVRVIVEGKLGRVARVLRLAQNADIVTLANRRIKSALAEANKRLSSANSGMRTRYMMAMRKQAKELIKTMQLAVSAQDNTKTSEKKRYAMLAERARLAEELKVIESGKTPDDLAKDETLTDRQHQDAVKLMFLEKFGDLSYTIDPAEVWAKAAEAEGFVVS